jgi:hypothetical protein
VQSSPITAVSPMTTPMPWSMNTRLPMVAPGWISMPVSQRVKCDRKRASQRMRAFHSQCDRPMQGQRVESRIAGQHLPGGTGGGVAFENAGDIFTQTGEHEPIFY